MKNVDTYRAKVIESLQIGPGTSEELRSDTSCKLGGFTDMMIQLCKDGLVKYRRFYQLNNEQTGGKGVDMWMLTEHAKYFGGGEYRGGSMSKHTPGNWESVGAAICVGEIDIARVYQTNGMDKPQFYANARLIAAAPELLEALENMVCWHVVREGEDDMPMQTEMQPKEVRDAIVAISKAKGES